MHRSPPVPVVVVLFGPPLPGRDVLERLLERELPGGTRILTGDFATRRERVAIRHALAAAGARAVFVARECSEPEAQTEIYRHYAGMPTRYADRRWSAFVEDLLEREPAADEVEPLVIVRPGDALDAIVRDVRARVGPGEPPPPVARRVLVVDDDLVQRELMADVLGALGCVVTTASSAEDAIELVREHPPDLVVTDHSMPGMTGVELAAALTAVQPGLRVAIVTGYPDEALDVLPRDAGVDLVLAKPVGIADLVHLVDELARAH